METDSDDEPTSTDFENSGLKVAYCSENNLIEIYDFKENHTIALDGPYMENSTGNHSVAYSSND